MPNFWVNGIVSNRNQQPYIQLSNDKGMIAQLSMGEARNVAMDILQMCARTEADAMVLGFLMQSEKFNQQTAAAVMQYFRDYRAEIDQEKVEKSYGDGPEHDEQT